MSGGKCKSCSMSACTQCTSTSYCTQCQGDWLLNASTHTCQYVYLTGTSDHKVEGCTGFSGTTASFTCTSCAGGYYYNTAKACTKCTLTGCQLCQNNQSASSPKCQSCSGGYYKASDGSCKLCTSKYGTQCATCDATNCLSCNSGYGLGEVTTGTASCAQNDNNFTCSDSNFMRIGNLCITRKNMGDASVLQIPPLAGVSSVTAGSDYCHSSSTKCCWQGKTAGSCTNTTDVNGSYLGCNRTVCNWEAANAICANYNYGGKSWRLPTTAEMYEWVYSSIGLKDNGLELCDSHSGYSSVQCGTAYRCSGSYDGNCNPNNVWSGTVSGSLQAFNYNLNTGKWNGPGANIRSNAFSVRCQRIFKKKMGG